MTSPLAALVERGRVRKRGIFLGGRSGLSKGPKVNTCLERSRFEKSRLVRSGRRER